MHDAILMGTLSEGTIEGLLPYINRSIVGRKSGEALTPELLAEAKATDDYELIGEYRLGAPTPLHTAVAFNDVDAVKLLVHHGVDMDQPWFGIASGNGDYEYRNCYPAHSILLHDKVQLVAHFKPRLLPFPSFTPLEFAKRYNIREMK
jgi:hypothetical protein